MATSIGIVKVLTGAVIAIAEDGSRRELHLGDKVYENETISTINGSVIAIQLNDGSMMDIGRNSQITLNKEALEHEAPHAPAAPAEGQPAQQPALTAEEIQKMILAGADPTKIAEATAAGGAPAAGATGGDGTEGGHSFVVVDYTGPATTPDSGYDTDTTPIAFSPQEGQFLLQGETGPEPTVSVSVSVDVEIGVGQPGDGGVILIPGDTTIPTALVSAIDIPEGTSVTEGGYGMHPVTFLITLDQVATAPVTITYTISPGTANNPEDFTDGALTGTVTIPVGYIGFTVTEFIVEDILVEGNESFTITLSNVIGATLGNDTATVTIVDDDYAPDAVDDTNWVQEDSFGIDTEQSFDNGHLTASGNVLQTIPHPHPDDPSSTLSFSDQADVDDNPLAVSWGA